MDRTAHMHHTNAQMGRSIEGMDSRRMKQGSAEIEGSSGSKQHAPCLAGNEQAMNSLSFTFYTNQRELTRVYAFGLNRMQEYMKVYSRGSCYPTNVQRVLLLQFFSMRGIVQIECYIRYLEIGMGIGNEYTDLLRQPSYPNSAALIELWSVGSNYWQTLEEIAV